MSIDLYGTILFNLITFETILSYFFVNFYKNLLYFKALSQIHINANYWTFY